MDKNTFENGFQCLAGILCCSNFLEEIPLPTVNHGLHNDKTLLNDPKDSEEAKALLSSDDSQLIEYIEGAMSAIDTNDIDLLEGYDTTSINLDLIPSLMNIIIARNNNLKNKREFSGFIISDDNVMNCDNGLPQNSIDNTFNTLNYISEIITPISDSSKNNMDALDDKSQNIEELKVITDSIDIENSSSYQNVDINIETKHSKEKKKKHKHKKKKHKHKSSKEPIETEETTKNQYSIKCPNFDSQKIVVSLVKRPSQEDEQIMSPKKHKKKKKKEKHKKEMKNEMSSPNINNNNSSLINEPIGKIKLKVARNGDNAKIISSTIPVSDNSDVQLNNNMTGSPVILKGLNKTENLVESSISSNIVSNYTVSNTMTSNSVNITKKYSQICDITQTTASSTPTKMEISSTSSYISTPTNDRINPYSNNSMNILTNNCYSGINQDLTPTSNNNSILTVNTMQIWNSTQADKQTPTTPTQTSLQSQQDDNFDLSIPIDITGEDLLSPLNLNGASHNLLNSMFPDNVVDSFLLDDIDGGPMIDQHRVGSSVGNLGAAMNDHHGGLASYLSNGASAGLSFDMGIGNSLNQMPTHNYGISNDTSIPKYSQENTTSTRQHHRYKRQKKRKNELEGLKTWFVGSGQKEEAGSGSCGHPMHSNNSSNQHHSNDPFTNHESSWDKAINNYSQSISDKKRKRNATRQSHLDSAFLYENDEEYTQAAEEDEISRRSLRGANATNYVGMDEEFDDDLDGSKAKRRKKDDDEPFEMKLKDPNEIKYPHLKKNAQELNKKRRERVVELTKVSNNGKSNSSVKIPADMIDKSLITESSTYQRFMLLLEQCLDMSEEIDFSDILKVEAEMTEKVTSDPTLNFDTHQFIPEEVLISRDILQNMCSDIAKLKASGSTKDISEKKMSKLCTLLMLNIKTGARVNIPGIDGDSEEGGNRASKDIAVEKVGRSLDSSFIVMNIMTSPEISKGLIIEDVIDSVVFCVKHHLNNLVFPEYDPAYRAKNSAKDNQMSIKWKRARERETTKSRSIIYFYNRIVDIISSLAELVCLDALTDTVILQLSTIAVSVFFVENVNEIQLVALRLITTIFSKYEKHRDLIIKDIFSSLSRLPSSKKNLRLYRLNSEESIQMLTALALLLVQSVVNLDKIKSEQSPSSTPLVPNAITNNTPNKSVTSEKSTALAKIGSSNEIVASKEFVHDREVLIENSYNNSLQTAYNFLNLFLQKATVKGEEDYKVIFDNFVTDLLLAVNKPEWPAAETMLSMLGSLLMKQFTNKQCDQSTRVTCIDYMGNVAATLRRDAVSSTMNEEDIDAVIQDLIHGNERSSDEEGNNGPGGGGDNSVEESNEPDDSDDNDDSSQNGSPNKNGIKKKLKAQQVFKPPKKNQLSAAKLKQMDKVMILRDAILDYLEVDKYDLTSKFSSQYYFGQWYSDCTREIKSTNTPQPKETNSSSNHKSLSVTPLNKQNSKQNFMNNLKNNLPSEAALQLSEDRKHHLLFKLFGEVPSPFFDITTCNSKKKKGTKHALKTPSLSNSNPYDLQLKGTLDYEDACLACRYLASLKPFSQSFNIYISKICRLLDDNSVAVRTKSMRCLSTVVDADSSILSRKDIELSVSRRLLDSNSSVREAAVELVGKYLLTQPQLIAQYYPMIADRILDKGTSVRKRVIRIFRDICIEHSEFPKVPEICVKMIRRINDEESIKKLVNEVFQNMWFCPVKERETVKLLQKVMNITDVVSACNTIGYEWFDQLLEGLLKREDQIISSSGYGAPSQSGNSTSNNNSLHNGPTNPNNPTNNQSKETLAALEKVRTVERACRQIVDCLVQNIMRLEEISQHQSSGQRLVSCLATLHLFTKCRPQLMVQYAMTLQPYLTSGASRRSASQPTNPTTQQNDTQTLLYVTKILELVVPLMEHPAPRFINQLENEMMHLMMTQGKTVLAAAAACLAASVNKISLNYPLVRESFIRLYYNYLKPQKNKPISPPLISRALFTVGLLCKHFDLDLLELEEDINTKVFETLMIYAEDYSLSCDIRTKAISGIGFLCVRHKAILCSSRLSNFYHSLLLNKLPINQLNIKDYPLLVCCVIDNISLFLLEEDFRLRNLDNTWKNHDKKASLKEMGDVNSGMGSHVAQLYLLSILESVLMPWTDVRTKAINLLSLIIRQGLTSPVSSVPYLIAAQTDPCSANRVKADLELAEIDKRFGGFVNIKAVQGIRLSCQLQEILYLFQHRADYQLNWFLLRKSRICPSAVRGVLDASVDIPLSLNHNLYTMVRHSKVNRRAFLNSLLALFDDGKSKLSLLVYVADNLAQFPYQCQEEPLYIVHQIEFIVSAVGPTHIHQIKMAIYPEFAAAFAAALNSTENNNTINNEQDTNNENVDENVDCLQDNKTNTGSLPPISKKLDAIRFDDDDDPESLSVKIQENPDALKTIRSIIRNSRGVLLLIALKQYLRELYSLTDIKVSKYNPADSGKAWERQLTRRHGLRFDPIKAVRLGSYNPEGAPRDKHGHIIQGTLAWEDLYNKMIDNKNFDDSENLELSVDENTELFSGEIRFLINEFQHIRNLVLSLDPLDIVADSDEEKEQQQNSTTTNVNNHSATTNFVTSAAHNMAVIQGQGLRVELDKLDLTKIPQIVNSKRLVNQKKTLVPQITISSSDEEEVKEKKPKRSNQIAKTVRRQRPSRYATTKKRPMRISSSDESQDDESDPDFLG